MLSDMRTVASVVLAIVIATATGCSMYFGDGDTEVPEIPEEPAPGDACAELAAITAPVPNVREILVPGWFTVEGDSEHCQPTQSGDRPQLFTRTRKVLVRLDTFDIGTYGQRASDGACEWRYAAVTRVGATGECP